MRAAEACGDTLVTELPLAKLVRIFLQIIPADFPDNYIAVKMLTRMVEQRSADDTAVIVAAVMPVLLRAIEDPKTIFSRAAVFCVVEISKRAPRQLKPYLQSSSSLNSRKMRVLNVYVEQANKKTTEQQQQQALFRESHANDSFNELSN